MRPQVPPSPRALALELRKDLERLADSAAARQAGTYFREPVEVLGVGTPDLRRLVREAHRRVARAWGLREALTACDLLLRDRRVEVKGAGLVLLGRFRRRFEPSVIPVVERWLTADRCDSWASVDALCSEVLWPLLDLHPFPLARTGRWASSPNRWVRRASLVSLVPMARRGERLPFVYSVALRLLDDKEGLVQKACGWLLREAGKTDASRLEAFLRRHGPRVRRTTFRYAIERFPAAKRAALLVSTRTGAG
ncbi:MAG: DNA alkylation repair protein [Planctomycetes bacterium]|nr:DNA alkylation repair protein [Planctomycetota bacterium]